MNRLSGQFKRSMSFSLQSTTKPFLFKRKGTTNLTKNRTNVWVHSDQAFLLVQSPTSIVMNWVIQKETRDMVALHFNESWRRLHKKIRLHDVTKLIFSNGYSNRFIEVEVPEMTDNWHFHQLDSGCSYLAEFGVGENKDQFLPLFRTNTIDTPIWSSLAQNEPSSLDWKQVNLGIDQWQDQFSAYTIYE